MQTCDAVEFVIIGQKFLHCNVTTANTVGGKLVPHKLVFLNACLTGDGSSASKDFATAFNADAYVGWSGPQYDTEDFVGALQLFTNLSGKDTNGNIISPQIGAALFDVNQNPLATQYIPTTQLKVIGDQNTVVKLK